MSALPPWTWDIPEYFNIGVACTDAHLGTTVEQRVAVICDDDAGGVRQATFGALAGETSRFCQLLRDLHVEAGDRVLIRLPNCLEYSVVFLGALKRGAVPVPTSILLTAEEVLFLIKDSGARALVTDRTTWSAMHAELEALGQLSHVLLTGTGAFAPAARLQAIDLPTALAAITHCGAAQPTRADDRAYLVYTSGTTGYPKGVLHAHRALLGHQPASRYWFDFQQSGPDRVLHSGKYNWTYVLGTGLMDPLYRGSTTIVHEGSNDPAVWPRLIARHGATIFIGVPTLYRHIIQRTDCNRSDVPTLRHCMCAGEPLSGEVLAAWRERFDLDIHEGLGMTECSYYISQPKEYAIRPGSAGFPQPGHDVKLLDPATLREVPAGEEGMLCVPRRDPALMLQYWNRPEEMAATFRDDWFLTGDHARLDADGYLWFLGRRDDLINTFGYRVSPYEVERVLKDHPDVADCAAIGEPVAPDKVLVAAYVMPRPGSALRPEDVIAYGRQHLAAYKAPRLVYLVDELPRTRNGKVLRRALKAPAKVSPYP